MAKVLLYGCFHWFDLAVTLIVLVYLIISAVKLCVKAPWSPLIAIAFLAAASFLSLCLINLKRWVKLANTLWSSAYKSVKGWVRSIFGKRGRPDSSKSQSYDHPMTTLEKITEGDSKGMESVPSYSSFDFFHKKPQVNKEYFHNSSQQLIALQSHNEIGYFSFYSDHGRRYCKAFSSSEDASLIGRFADRIAFYSYFDPNAQNVNQSEVRRFLCGFNFWFKHVWIKPLLHNEVWVLSGIIITVTWCIVWEWAASYMEREEGNYNLLHWSVDNVPRVYWMFERAFQLIFGMTYLIQLYDYDIRCRYILSLRGFIDLTMTPVLTETITWVSGYFQLDMTTYGSINSFGLLFFGPLRFLKLIQAEELLNKSFDHLSDLQTIIIGIATAAVSLLFAFSGMMYLFEAPQRSINFNTPFDFIYFGVATMGTVGYGDFTPMTLMGRLISIMLICTCISLGAVHFKRLKEAISTKGINMGSRLDLSGRRYVLFWGPLSEYQLLTFCRCVSNSFEGVLDTVVIATPLPLESYKVIYRAVKRNTRIKLFMVGGKEKICTPSYVYKLIGFSTLTVIVNDMERDGSHDHVINDDRMVILRSISALNITKHLGIPISIQMHGSEYATYMDSSSISRVFYLREFKYKLFAKSVACRGLFYLILALFHTPTNSRRTRAYVEDLCNLFATSNAKRDEESPGKESEYSMHVKKPLFELVTGMQFQLYRLTFPECTHGLKFADMCQYLYKTKNMFLLGIVSKDTCILNPVDYVIGSHLDSMPYQGLVMAMSLRDVLHVSMLKSASLDFLPHKTAEMVATSKMESFSPTKNSAGAVIYEKRDVNLCLFKGIHKVDHYEEALHAFAEPRAGVIVVCGWLHDMHCFLKTLLLDNNYNLICLSPKELIEDHMPSLAEFRGAVVYIDGSSLELNDLSRAGVTHASCIIVLNSDQASTREYSEKLTKDSQVLLSRHLIKHIINSSNDRCLDKPPHIILDIQHSVCLEYLDPSLVSSMEAACGRDAMNRVWQNFGEFMTSYEMASGAIFVQDMFYGLLAHSYVPCEHSVGYDTIQRILNSDAHSMVQNNICLEEVAAVFHGKTFKSLFKYQLGVEHHICIGILRTYRDPVFKAELRQLVIVPPQPSFLIQSGDQVYVVYPNR